MAIYFGILHMEISVPKTKVMSLFAEGAPITAFTCNGLPVEKVDSFKYLDSKTMTPKTVSLVMQTLYKSTLDEAFNIRQTVDAVVVS